MLHTSAAGPARRQRDVFPEKAGGSNALVVESCCDWFVCELDGFHLFFLWPNGIIHDSISADLRCLN